MKTQGVHSLKGGEGQEEKQSLISSTNRRTLAGMLGQGAASFGENPRTFRENLQGEALKSCNSLHPPEAFVMTNTGVFHRLREGRMCCSKSCSFTACMRASSFSLERGYHSTQMTSFESQSRQGVLKLIVALRIGGDMEGKAFYGIIFIKGTIIDPDAIPF